MELKKHVLVIAQINKSTFEFIRSGEKKIETRAGSPTYQNIKAGDILVFSCEGEEFEKNVSAMRHFASIADLLKVYTPEQVNPETHSEDELTRVYHSYPNYEEKIKEFGLLAFELE
ncbi:MAG: hypothetical protein V4473_01965 [Patescibacteria group bacterium]